MKTVYIDECKESPYLLAGHLVDDSRSVAMRRSFKNIFPKPIHHFHFSQERNDRRKKVLTHFVNQDCFGLLVICKRESGKPLRETALRALLSLAEVQSVERFVLDLDIGTKSLDDRIFKDYNRQKDYSKKARWDHVDYEDEPLLWVADGLCWAYNRKGHWAQSAKPLIRMESFC